MHYDEDDTLFAVKLLARITDRGFMVLCYMAELVMGKSLISHACLKARHATFDSPTSRVGRYRKDWGCVAHNLTTSEKRRLFIGPLLTCDRYA